MTPVRVPAARHQVGDGDPVRGDRGLRQQPEPAGHLLGLVRADVRAVEHHLPGGGVSSRDRPRSRVDLPQAFGPTITVNEPSGIDSDRSLEMIALVVADESLQPAPTAVAASRIEGRGQVESSPALR